MEQINDEDFSMKIENLRKTQLPRLKGHVYLDHAGSALYTDMHISKYYEDLQTKLCGNPHSGNAGGAHMSSIISQVRSTVASFFNVSTDDYDVIFTGGATDSLRLVGEYLRWNQQSHFVYLEDNHTSVVGIREMAAAKRATVHCLSAKTAKKPEQGAHDLSEYVAKRIKGDTKSIDSNAVSGEAPCLFAFPIQSNFSGAKYPLTWITDLHKKDNAVAKAVGCGAESVWYILCDAASYVSTSFLDLKKHEADFVPISFYKIFGFPTGLGALLVKKTIDLSKKTYFGGGSVSGWLATEDYFAPKQTLHDRLEDGSPSFLGILAVMHGFDTFNQLGLSPPLIQSYAFDLLQKCHEDLVSLKHYNGTPVVKIYRRSVPMMSSNQGPILAFNVQRADGGYIGFNHVLEMASNQGFHLRGGCFCNMGACSSLLGLSTEELLQSYKEGHVCGDKIDAIDGKPIGALRISFGYCSVPSDAKKFISFLSTCFREECEESCDVFYDALSDVAEDKVEVKLEKITIYPVKSCQGFEVKSWGVGPTGLLYDRTWMVIDEHSVCLTLKKEPRLILIKPEIDVEMHVLKLHAPGVNDIEIPFIINSTSIVHALQPCTSRVCGDKVEGLDCGKGAGRWISDVLGYRCRLLQKHLEKDRFVKKGLQSGADPYTISLANEAQYLMINRASIESLQKIIIEGARKDIDENLDCLTKRFRSNFVISGPPPFAEDSWSSVVVNPSGADSGKVGFSVCGLCNRCSMVCINPVNGEKVSEPLRSLAKMKTPDNLPRKATFGVYLKCKMSEGSVMVNSAIDFTAA